MTRPYASTLLMLLAITGCLAGSAGDKPAVVNFTSGPLTDLDQAIIDHFDKFYSVVNIDAAAKGHSYGLPQGLSGFGPTAPVYVQGHCVAGTALVSYVITADGAVTSAFVLKSTDPSLDAVARQRMEERRFRPAELDGKPTASIAATRFVFPCPT
jgi:TonB family protein